MTNTRRRDLPLMTTTHSQQVLERFSTYFFPISFIMVAKYRITDKAVQKLIAHSAKFSNFPVFGVLIGSKSEFLVSDSIPLFHSELLPTPTLQMALDLISSRFENAGMQIVGLYFANKVGGDKTVHPGIKLLAQKIDDLLNGESLLVCIDPLNPNGIEGLMLQGENWTTAAIQSPTVSKSLYELETYQRLHDFEEHLFDTKVDWLENESFVNSVFESQ